MANSWMRTFFLSRGSFYEQEPAHCQWSTFSIKSAQQWIKKKMLLENVGDFYRGSIKLWFGLLNCGPLLQKTKIIYTQNLSSAHGVQRESRVHLIVGPA